MGLLRGYPHSILIALCLILFSQSQSRAGTVVNFDTLSDGDSVTNQFPGLVLSNAIILTAGVSLNEFEFPPRSNFNVVSDSGGPITISFTTPTLSFAGYFTYLTPLTLTAFDSGNVQVGQVSSLFANNLALSGDLGSSPNELLQVLFASGIARVTIAGDPSGGSFTLDDVTFDTGATDSPEPNSVFLLAGVLTIVALRIHFKTS